MNSFYGLLGGLLIGCSSTLLVNTASFAKVDSQNILPQKNTSKVEFLNGTWEGTYTCSQGLTNLKLVIDAQSTTEIDAVFLFSAHRSNPNVPSGRFRMAGTLEVFDSPEIPDLLELNATNWINRPSRWKTIDLVGDISSSKRKITGNVQGSKSCTTFNVVKREK